MFVKKSKYKYLEMQNERIRSHRDQLLVDLSDEINLTHELRRQLDVYKNKEKRVLTLAELKEHKYAEACYDKAMEEIEKGNYEAAEYLFTLFDNHELYKYFKEETKHE